MGEGAGAIDGLEWVQRQAMKMIKGREGLIYKTRLEEQYCPAWLGDSSRAGSWEEGGGPCVRVREALPQRGLGALAELDQGLPG